MYRALSICLDFHQLSVFLIQAILLGSMGERRALMRTSFSTVLSVLQDLRSSDFSFSKSMLIHNEDYVYNVYFFIALISQKIDGSLEKKLKFPLITARGKSKKKIN